MKIMLVSDIHGNLECLDKVLRIYYKEKVDKIIFLGDFYSFYIKDEIDERLSKIENKYIIKGNCDSNTDVLTSTLPFMDSYYFEAFNRKIFCTHGNIYNEYKYPDVDFDILIHGHTHVPMILKKDNKYFLNPGSISYPRGGSKNSYMVINDNEIFLKDLEENIIEKIFW